jgi:hypothetical protein
VQVADGGDEAVVAVGRTGAEMGRRSLEKARAGGDNDATEGKQCSNSSGGCDPRRQLDLGLEGWGAKRTVAA